MNILEKTLETIRPAGDADLRAKLEHRLDHLTKPRGSLGVLEEIAVRYGLARATSDVSPCRQSLFVFCGDHGVTAEGVSAYPSEVTAQMVKNFVAGGAAINALCRQLEIDPVIVDMGVRGDFLAEPKIVHKKIAEGTKDFLHEPAMTAEQARESLEAGISLASAAARMDYGLVGIGEMGIGNTTSASAIAAALTGLDPEELTGSGTGIDEAARRRKIEVVRAALERHRLDGADPCAVLACVGGFEIGGMAGFCLGAAAGRIPVAVDGFIASTAALLAIRLCPAARDYLFFSHRSAETGHRRLLEALDARPLLALDMRLGEGTGAALAMSLITCALRIYAEMATFDTAGVSTASAREGG